MFDESFSFVGRPSPSVDMSHNNIDLPQDCFFTGITNDAALKSNTLPRSYPRARYQQSSAMSQALHERRRRRISVGSLTTCFQSTSVADATLQDKETDAYQLPTWPSPTALDLDSNSGLDLLSSSPTSSAAGISGPPTPTSLVSPFTYMHSHEQSFFPPTLERYESMESVTSSSSTGTNGPTSEPAAAQLTTSITTNTNTRPSRPQLYTSQSTSSYFSLPSPSYASNTSSASRSRYKRRRALTPLDLPASHLSLLDLIAREERHPSELNDAPDSPSRSPTPEDWARNTAALEKLGVNVVGPFWGYKPVPAHMDDGMEVVDEEPVSATVSVTEAGRTGRIGKRSSSGSGHLDSVAISARTRSVSRESGKKRVGKSGRGL